MPRNYTECARCHTALHVPGTERSEAWESRQPPSSAPIPEAVGTDPALNDDGTIRQPVSFHSYWCTSCAAARCFTCHECNTFAYSSPLTRVTNLICWACFYRTRARCSQCSQWVAREHAHQDGTRFTCNPCWERDRPIADDGFETNPSTRTLGVELEHIAANDVSNLILPWGHFKTDGSVRVSNDRPYNREFVSKVSRGDAHVKLITSACKVMKEDADGAVNASCGFHCHVGVSDLDTDQRQNLRGWWRVMQTQFYGLVKQERRGNQYCCMVSRGSSDRDWESMRYHGLNIAAFNAHGTYEFRLHHGTLDHRRVTAWSVLLAHWVDTFANINPTLERVQAYQNASDYARLSFICDRASVPSFVHRDVFRRARLYRSLDLSDRGGNINV